MEYSPGAIYGWVYIVFGTGIAGVRVWIALYSKVVYSLAEI